MRNPVQQKAFLERARGCLLGVAIGDAMGMPVETMKHEEILAQTGGEGIIDFTDPIVRKDWIVGQKAGNTTDDWQLTRAVGNSLVRTGKTFNQRDCAQEHVRELAQSRFGWGGTTQTAIEAIRDGIRVIGRDALPPAPQGKGCGNGIVMKVAPLAICNALLGGTTADLWRDVRSLGEITHPDIRASIAAYAVAFILRDIMTADDIFDRGDGMVALSLALDHVRDIEEGEEVSDHLVSAWLERVFAGYESAESLRKSVGSGFSASETAAFALGTFLRYPNDFRTGVLEAVNAGGDTDTNASVVGALIGANCGTWVIPEAWRAFNPSFAEAIDLAERICS